MPVCAYCLFVVKELIPGTYICADCYRAMAPIKWELELEAAKKEAKK